jgi:UDP-GlcNAc:undecaprenyl-phosphate GlcNAc-1-phosphate transferase
MNPVLLGGIVAGLALIFTATLTPVVRGAAIAGGMVRQVQADRWHRRPTPAIGGVAIFLGFGFAVGVGYLLDPNALQDLTARPVQAVLPWSTWEGLVLAATLAFIVGLVDDFVHLPPVAKLGGQVLASLVLLLSGIGVWLTGWYPADAAISLFWFIGITNALNLLDNMDGVATGIAAIAGTYMGILFLLEGAPGLAILAFGFVAALLGFLAHNYPPARIFMGDAGSLFLGLFLAGLALAPAPGLSRSLAAVFAAPVLILGVPILDTSLVTIGRLLEGRAVSEGGKDHASHRLVDLGVPERRTLWMLWGLAAAGGGVGLLLRSADRGTAVVLGGTLVALLTLVGAYLLTVRFRNLEETGGQGTSLYRFLVRAHQRYPVFALLLDGVWIGIAYYLAYLLRWESGELQAELPYFQRTVLLWVALKLAAFVVAGAYGARWPSFGLFDAIRIGRANLLGTLVAASAVLLVERVGLSRGVVAIDLLVCALLTVGGRISFRILEGATRRLSEDGAPAVIVGTLDEVEQAARLLQGMRGADLRVVAAACPELGAARSRIGTMPVYGGGAALRHAVEASGASAVVVLDRGEGHGSSEGAVRSYLEREGGVDAYLLSIDLSRLEGPA